MSSRAQLRLQVERGFHRARSFTGWGDFPIQMETLGPPLPWNYDELAAVAVRDSTTTLDLDTGGGERLKRIVGMHPARVVATEAWAPNATLAAERLRALGVGTVRCSARSQLPFRDGVFDLLINRHGDLDPDEIARVLNSSGRLLTQQVDPGDWPEIREQFPRMTDFSDNDAERCAGRFRELGFTVSTQRHDYQVAYGSLEDLTFNLAVTPWTIPGFSIATDFDALCALYDAHMSSAGLIQTRSLYLLSAVRESSEPFHTDDS